MPTPVPTPRLLIGMTLGALVAAFGALFLGEYEFDEALPIGAGVLMGYLVAEVVVSIGKHRSTGIARPSFWDRARYYNQHHALAAALDRAQG